MHLQVPHMPKMPSLCLDKLKPQPQATGRRLVVPYAREAIQPAQRDLVWLWEVSSTGTVLEEC